MVKLLRKLLLGSVLFGLSGALLVPTQQVLAVDATDAGSADQVISDAKKNQEEIADKEKEIADLNKQIADLKGKQATTANEAALISSQVARIKGELDKAELQLKRTRLNIRAVQGQQKTTQSSIKALDKEIADKRKQLKELIKILYQKDQMSLMSVFLLSGTFSDMLAEQANVTKIQNRYIELISDLHRDTEALKNEQQKLVQQADDLAQLNQMQAAQQADLADRREQQETFLKAKKQEQLRYEQKIAEAEQARKEIEENVYTLKNAGVQLTFTQAKDMAKYAGSLTGVRPALLLGVLKVESNVGANLGSGKFPDDMQPQSREPFLRITKDLGLDPYNTPISARPRNFQGWGGAMGPAQIMPQTWEGIASRIGQLMHKAKPNPYELTDAFVGTAILLADKGAANPAQEYEAVNRYMAGPNWQNFTWYGDRVLAVAKEYAQ